MATSKSTQADLSANNYMIIFVLITLLVLGVTALGGKLLVTSILRDGKVVKAKSVAITNLNSDITNAPQLVDSYQALGDKAQVLTDALPSTPDFPSLIVALEAMGNGAGLTIKAISPTQVAAGGTATGSAGSGAVASSDPSVPPLPQAYDFTINFSGGYGALQKFLGEVEVSARPMRVTGVQVVGTGSSLSGELSVATDYQAAAQWPFGTETIK